MPKREYKTCGTCKCWKPPPSHLDEDDWEARFPGLRICAAVEHDSDYPPGVDGPDPSARAVVHDGSGYYAVLRTREDFGCVLWEPSDAEA